MRGGLLPGWVKRAAKGKRDFWRDWDFDAEELESRDSYVLGKKEGESGSVLTTGGVGVGMAVGQAERERRSVVSMDGIITGDRRWELDSGQGYPMVSTTSKMVVRAQTSSPSRR